MKLPKSGSSSETITIAKPEDARHFTRGPVVCLNCLVNTGIMLEHVTGGCPYAEPVVNGGTVTITRIDRASGK